MWYSIPDARKSFQFIGLCPQTSDQGLFPWTLLGAQFYPRPQNIHPIPILPRHRVSATVWIKHWPEIHKKQNSNIRAIASNRKSWKNTKGAHRQEYWSTHSHMSKHTNPQYTLMRSNSVTDAVYYYDIRWSKGLTWTVPCCSTLETTTDCQLWSVWFFRSIEKWPTLRDKEGLDHGRIKQDDDDQWHGHDVVVGRVCWPDVGRPGPRPTGGRGQQSRSNGRVHARQAQAFDDQSFHCVVGSRWPHGRASRPAFLQHQRGLALLTHKL